MSKTDPILGRWVHTQRQERKRGKLSQERIGRLDQLGFTWSRHQAAWEEQFDELTAFQQQHGHCNVSTLSRTHAALGNWVRTQRRQRLLGKLSQEQVQRLDQLGFTWNIAPDQWEQMFAALAKHKRIQGHCRVSLKNRKLCSWVYTQRIFYRKGKLTEEQIRRLEALGFQWRAK